MIIITNIIRIDYLDYHQASAKPYPQEGLEGELASNYGDAPSAYLGS